MANKRDPAENRQDLLQIGIMSLWVQYSTRNMGLPSAKRKSDKTQIGLFIGGEVEFEAVITGNQLITKKEKVSLDAGQSKKIYATFTKIIKEEKRVVTVTVPDMNKVSKSITVEPFFVNF